MNCTESAVQFSCGADTLLGIVSAPCGTVAALPIGVVLVVGGPQYRAGSHRQFVSLARDLAGAGIHVLRFDVRGMGDSSGTQRNFESIDQDIKAAVDCLTTHVATVQRVVLWGLCDGASAALLYVKSSGDERVAALCLLNPWVRSEATLALTHVKHYYAQRLLQKAFWLKLLSGAVGRQALVGLRDTIKAAFFAPAKAARSADDSSDYRVAMAQAWRGFNRPILLILSGNDLTAKEFLAFSAASPAWQHALCLTTVTRHDLPKADHTLSNHSELVAANRITKNWVINMANAFQ